MHLNCVICKELFISHSNAFVLNCGHLYHELCINQWLKNKSNCPQCRTKCKGQPLRVYFNIDEEIALDPATLQYRLDQSTYKVQELQGQLKSLKEKLDASLDNEKCMRGMVQELECQQATDKQYISGLKTELKMQIQNGVKLKNLNIELEKTKSELFSFQTMDRLMKITSNQVKDLLKDVPCTPDSLNRLGCLVEALKVKNENLKEKCKDLQNKCIRLESKYVKIDQREEAFRREVQALKDKIEMLENEIENNDVPSFSQKSCYTIDSSPEVLPVTKRIINIRDGKCDAVTRKRTLLSATCSNSSETNTSISTTHQYDGFGGTRKRTLVTPTSREDLIRIKMKKQAVKRPTLSNDVRRRGEFSDSMLAYIQKLPSPKLPTNMAELVDLD